MNRKLIAFFALAVSLLIFCGTLFAHHGEVAYNDKAVVLDKAVVTKLVWANPHVVLLFDYKDEKGNLAHWAGEAGSPSALIIAGWTKNVLHPGDVVTVHINQAKTGNPVGRLNKVVRADGKEFLDSNYSPKREDGK